MQNKLSNEEKLSQIFFPHYTQRRQDAITQNQHFVYYSSAETAMSIIKNKNIWMRNAICMNDFSEVQYGISCLKHAYDSPTGKKFQSALNSISKSLCDESAALFDSHTDFFKYDTYLTCISEYSGTEDISGRLSMWRAYGRESGVALVLNNESLLSLPGALNAYLSPVAYKLKEDIEEEIDIIRNNIEINSAMLQEQDPEIIKWHVFNVFRFAAVCIKNPGFKEEKEWRIIYCPIEKSKHMETEKEVVAINGVPQLIYKLPLKEISEESFPGADIPHLIKKIIIGPSAHQGTIYKAFVELLAKAGGTNPERKVVISDIPLRC